MSKHDIPGILDALCHLLLHNPTIKLAFAQLEMFCLIGMLSELDFALGFITDRANPTDGTI